jgi:predicted ribosome quality control (RQC) complex YloA/Tae2 family protein
LCFNKKNLSKVEMDLFILHGIVHELQEEIVGGFITKIYQMNRTDLLFRMRRQGEEKQLIISTHPDFFRLHLTAKKYANPLVPPRFCTYLRKHITGARINEIAHAPYERIVRIALQRRLDAGVARDLVLVGELISKGSNLLLLEKGKILDCLHFHRPERGTPRPAAPGLDYIPPPAPDRPPADQMTAEKMAQIAEAPPGDRWKGLVQNVAGLSPLLAREVEFGSDGSAAGLWENFRRVVERYATCAFEPRIVSLLGNKKVLCPFPFKILEPAVEEAYPSMNRAADAYYFETVMGRQMADQKRSLSRRLKLLISRLQKRGENLHGDLEKFEQEMEGKALGEILTANFPRLKKGMKEVEVLDYRKDPPQPVLIALDESLEPAGNVQRYFKRYKKAKRGIEMAAERIRVTEAEIAYLETVLFQVEEAEDGEELENIRGELEAQRILPASKKRKTAKEKREPAIPVRKLRSSEGLDIFCGKHNVGNDYLLRKIAKENDLWFHAQGLPGSHVVIRVERRQPKFQSILEAATIAAFYSRGRDSGRTAVDYTEVKNLRKPKGARPGMVTYFHQKTILVEPDREKVEKLLVS